MDCGRREIGNPSKRATQLTASALIPYFTVVQLNEDYLTVAASFPASNQAAHLKLPTLLTSALICIHTLLYSLGSFICWKTNIYIYIHTLYPPRT